MNLETVRPVAHRVAVDPGAIVAPAASRMATGGHVFVTAVANPIGKSERIMRRRWPGRNQCRDGEHGRTKYRNPSS